MSKGPTIGAPLAYQAATVPLVPLPILDSTFELLITVIYSFKHIQTPS